jgi:hypothetical protein
MSNRYLLPCAIGLALAGTSACRSEPAATDSSQTPAAQPRPEAPARPAVQPPAAGKPAAEKPAVELTWDESRPRAPSKEGFGLVIGQASFAEVEAHAKKLGVTCTDASPASVARAAREARLAKLQAEAKEKGTVVDVLSAASVVKPSKYEKVPQVRYSCQDTSSAKLTDIERAPATGRLLFVLDSADHPLRHVSFQRAHESQAQALADMLATTAAYRKRLGEPNLVEVELPEQADATYEFPVYKNIVREWQFKDFRVKVAALRGNAGKVVIYENVEVPAALRMEPLAKTPEQPAQPGPAQPGQPGQPAQATQPSQP